MKSIGICIFFLFINFSVLSQEDSIRLFKKNEIKLDIFYPLFIYRNNKIPIQLFYERYFANPNQSLQISFSINERFWLGGRYSFKESSSIYHDTYSKSISLGYNFIFPNKNKFSSFSIFPFLKNSFWTDEIIDYEQQVTDKIIENRFSIAAGLGVGNKWIWMDKVSYQIYATGSKSVLKAKSKYQIQENRFEPRIGINLGFRF